MLCTKIKCTKLKRMRIINVNVLGKGSFVRKLHKTKIYCAKYFLHEIFAIYGMYKCIRKVKLFISMYIKAVVDKDNFHHATQNC